MVSLRQRGAKGYRLKIRFTVWQVTFAKSDNRLPYYRADFLFTKNFTKNFTNMDKTLAKQDWYNALVDECKAIITEAVFTSRWALVEGYWNLGKRIREDKNLKKYAKGNEKFIKKTLAPDIGISSTTIYYALQAYDKYQPIEKIPNGKNISWTKLKAILPSIPMEETLLPKGKYGVIYVDPPWPYPAHLDIKKLYGVAQQHYNLMSIKDICNLKVGKLAADNSVLFIWVATNFLEDSFKVINSWGFKYKSQMVWVKMPLSLPSVGYYVRSHHELLLIATKGSYLPKTKEYVKSVIEANRLKHSQKPDIFYKIIEKLYPDDKYIELFARRKRDGWQSWGDQV